MESPQSVEVGALAVIDAPVGFFAIYLPDGRCLPLHQAVVMVLDVRREEDGSRMVKFRPEPWGFGETWPNAWWAVESYFVACR